MDNYTELLRRVSLFEKVEPVELERLGRLLSPRRVLKDTRIVTRDEPGDSMFFIISGRVKVMFYGENSREVILTMLKDGEFFGEMSLLDGLPRSANVVAQEDSSLLILRRYDFNEHMQKSPSTAVAVMAELSRRLRRADEIIGNLSTLDVYGRVAHIVSDLAKKDGVEQENGILIRDRPTQQEIASMIGTSRETVSRVLSEFQRRGFVEMRGREILLSRRFAGKVREARQESN